MLRHLREPVNGLTHLAGAVLALAGLPVLIHRAATTATAWHVVSFAVFGVSLIVLYTASSLYHLLPVVGSTLQTLRKFDHMAIFVLIAGTYTPFCLVALRGPWGWSLFGAVWGLAVAGILMKLFWLHAPRWLSTSVYIAMGWIAAVAVVPLVQTVPTSGLIWMLTGGVSYTIGGVIYGLKRPNIRPGLGFHEIFHLFVMAGSVSHFWAILGYLPLL